MKISRFAVAAVPFILGLAGAAFSAVSFSLIYAVGELGIGRESFDRPVDVIEDRQENVYVLDQGNNRVQVLDRLGRYLRDWGSRGFAPRYFDTPTAIAADADVTRLFVVDTLNNRIQVFETDGTFAKTGTNGRSLTNPIGRLGSGNGDFNRPLGVAIDRKGNIYVADTGNNRVQKFDPSGNFLQEWGKFARRRGTQIENPVSIAYSDEGFGSIFVLNSPGCVVQQFDVEGNFLRQWPIHRKGEGAVCGPVSRIRIEPRRYTVYIADPENDRILLFDRDGEPLGVLKEGKVPFRKPGGLFVSDKFGETVVVADTGNNLIQKLRREQ